MTLSADGMIACAQDRRSGVLRDPAHPLNGIDFVEYRRDLLAPPGKQIALAVTFLKPPPVLVPANVEVLGGVRVVAIRPLAVASDPANPLGLLIFIDREGDFSSYVLRLKHSDLDEERSEARFGFKASCPSEFDCRVDAECLDDAPPEPALDYLAKDYQSFRRLLTDLIAERNPGWQERLPADLGMTLVELLAYAGDYLSYYQDAVATEAYLDTCLHRTSAARHARLIDYRMHQGRNAWTYAHFRAVAGTSGVVPVGAKLVTRIGRPLIGASVPPGVLISATADFEADPALTGATVFETTALARVLARHNELRIHSWDDARCCLAEGATEAFLYGLDGNAAGATAFRPSFVAGDYLLIEEVLSPVTGFAADADARHRRIVRLIAADDSEDAAFTDAVAGGALTPRHNVGDPALPLQRVRWGVADALPRPVCLSAESDDGHPIAPVSVARGNVAPIDHGRTRIVDSDRGELPLPDAGAGRWPLPMLHLPAGTAPLTETAMPDDPAHDGAGRLLFGRHDLARAPQDCAPEIVLLLDLPGTPAPEVWTPVPHLLDSGPYDQHFVAEVDADTAALRFGDDEYGRRPLGVTRARARLRVGNGRTGNIGAGALVHIVAPDPADPLDPADPAALLAFAIIERVYQPLSARDGIDAESIAQVRALAPEAFRAVTYRAVTEADWVEAALRHPQIAGAKASFRWTGSWHTVFVAIQPRSEDALRRLPGGGLELQPEFAARIEAHLKRFKLAGYDLVVRAAVFVPLEIDVRICVARGHLRGDVLAAVARALSSRDHRTGARGFFHHLAFAFGEPVYLSRLYAAIEAVPGVDSATVILFKRYWNPPGDALQRGVIALAPFEIARLENDPNHAEDGVLRLTAVGGL